MSRLKSFVNDSTMVSTLSGLRSASFVWRSPKSARRREHTRPPPGARSSDTSTIETGRWRLFISTATSTGTRSPRRSPIPSTYSRAGFGTRSRGRPCRAGCSAGRLILPGCLRPSTRLRRFPFSGTRCAPDQGQPSGQRAQSGSLCERGRRSSTDAAVAASLPAVEPEFGRPTGTPRACERCGVSSSSRRTASSGGGQRARRASEDPRAVLSRPAAEDLRCRHVSPIRGRRARGEVPTVSCGLLLTQP